ncbi:MAG: hypothetical protein IPJ06_12335 [Saprospiraceae bacterium]|nr:hypothetical protein [Saprospiraceae bacterium]
MTPSLPHNDVKVIHVDSRGWIWLITADRGLCLFDPSTERFYPLQISGYSAILEDAWQNIWVNDPAGRWMVISIPDLAGTDRDLEAIHTSFVIRPASEVFRGLPPDGLNLNILLSKKYGVSWIMGDTLVSYALNYREGTARFRWARPVRHAEAMKHFRHAPVLEDTLRKVIWLFDLDQIEMLNPQTGQSHRTIRLPRSVVQEFISPAMIDRQGRLYAPGVIQHFYQVDPDRERITLLRKSGIEAFSTYWKMLCSSPYEDHNGNIWFPTSGYGLYQYRSRVERFQYLGDQHIGPSSPPLYALTGNKIVKNDITRTEILDLNTRKLTEVWKADSYHLTNNIRIERFSCLSGDGQIWQLFHQKEKMFWYECDTLGRTIRQLSWPFSFGRLIQYRPFATSDKKTWLVNCAEVPNLLKDLPHLTLYQRQSANGPWTPHVFDRHPQGFLFGKLQVWMESADHAIWLGMSDGGLFRFEPQSKRWTHFLHLENNPRSLTGNRILSLAKDPHQPDRYLWVGTYSGLNRLNLENGDCDHFTTREGLPDNVIYGILCDDHDNFWLSTNQGLCIFSPSGKCLRTFVQEDGLQHNEFNKGAYVRMPDGRMVFGGVGGLTWFDPEDFYQSAGPSPVVINGLRIINRRVEFSRAPNTDSTLFRLERPVEYLQEITLDHTQRMITFEFACLDLTHPAKNRFRYRLVGFDRDWVDAGDLHEATYTNLSPRHYTFTVQGRNADQVWNLDAATIRLNILPPWWATWWFRTLAIGALISLIYSAVRYRIKEKEKRHLLRNRISKDLHDEIGSTLSSIAIFSAVAKKKIRENDQVAVDMLDRIGDSSTQVMESINDIVWAIKSDNDRMEHVIRRMRAYISEHQDIHTCVIDLTHDQEIIHLEMNMVQRRNVYMVFKEAVNNALKYAQSKHISIHIKALGRQIQMRIQDDGVGFDTGHSSQKKLSLGGNGLENMRIRAREVGGQLEIHSISGEGTTVVYTWEISGKNNMEF